jgi:hypothetical protein
MRFWLWLDGVTVDGRVDGVTSQDVDGIVDAAGFANALISVGWLQVNEEAESVVIPNFDRHNGETAKARALASKRQSKWRKSRNGVPYTSPSTRPSTGALPEKRREEKTIGEVSPITPRSRRSNGKPAVDRNYSPDFLRFWDLYPAVRKGSKPLAWAAWQGAVLRRPAADILAAVEEYSCTPMATSPYCPGPAPWLNQDRWDDDRESWKSSGTNDRPKHRMITLDD